MIQSNLGAGYSLVPVAPELNPNVGGGPIRKSGGGAVTYAQAGNTVYRTPNTVTREAEPGAAWPGDLSQMMFDMNGKLRPAAPYAFDMFHGADTLAPAAVVYAGGAGLGGGFFYTLVPVLGLFAGAAVGYNVSDRRKGWGTLVGALAGGILGRIFR